MSPQVRWVSPNGVLLLACNGVLGVGSLGVVEVKLHYRRPINRLSVAEVMDSGVEVHVDRVVGGSSTRR